MEPFQPSEHVRENAVKEDAYWLGLQDKTWLVPASKMVRVYEEYGTLLPLWNASYFLLRKMGIGEEANRKFMRYKEQFNIANFATELKKLEAMRIKLIRFIDKDYPDNLKTIENPPLVLLHKGALLNFENCIAISGTRNPSLYGRVMARKIGKSLAEKGFTVVSGLARGIDEWAHCGALEAHRGRSIAVLAWMNPIYPGEHIELALDLQKRGSILAEIFQQPQNRSASARFVQRNRIISGISRCVIAIESDEEGGTVHQVKIALSQKRKVFALQPKGNERAKRGFKVFVDMGAIPVKSVKDILHLITKEVMPLASGSRLDSYYQHLLGRGTLKKNNL
jgi:DNA processing protein